MCLFEVATLKGSTNQKHLLKLMRKAQGSHKLCVRNKMTRNSASSRLQHLTSRGRMLKWHCPRSHRQSLGTSGMRSYKNGCSKITTGARSLHRSPLPCLKEKKDHDWIDLAVEDCDQLSAQKGQAPRALNNTLKIEAPRRSKLTIDTSRAQTGIVATQ